MDKDFEKLITEAKKIANKRIFKGFIARNVYHKKIIKCQLKL